MLPNKHLALKELTSEIKEKLFNDIREFRNTFDLPVAQPDGFTSKHDDLHTSLYLEELQELALSTNKIDIADSIGDQVYVLVGRVVQHGGWSIEIEYIVDVLMRLAKNLDIDFLRCWDEIHSSNMSKTAKNTEEYEACERFYAENGVKVEPTMVNGLIVIKCAEDTIYKESEIKKGKVMKSIYYKEADLSFVGELKSK